MQAWGESYREALTARDLFALQARITRGIAGALEARLSAAERERIEREPTQDLEAYRLYVEGRTHLDQRTGAGLRQGADAFRRAIAVDSTYALSWSGLADALTLLAVYGHAPRDSTLPAAEEAAERALALDADLAEAHASRGLIYQSLRRDGPAALRELRRAVELKPSYARAYHWLGNLLTGLGRLEEAGEALRRAAELDTTSPPIRVSLASWYHYADSLDTALEEARRAEALSPSYPSAVLFVGESLRRLGRVEEATAALHRARELPGVNPAGYPGVWVELALIQHSRGDTAAVRELLGELEAGAPPLAVAAAYASMGRRDTAIALISSGPLIADLAGVLRYHSVFDSVRDHPRFREVIRDLNRAWGLEPDGSLPGEGSG